MLDTEVGYTGGGNARPTYGSVCSGDGHTEALKVTYNPSQVSFDELMDTFWSLHNPAARYDTQYMSAIWPQNAEQERKVREAIELKELTSVLPIQTVVAESKQFYKAEWYHQNYKFKNGIRMGIFAAYIVVTYIPPGTIPQQALISQVLSAVLFATYVPQLISVFDKFF